MSPNIDPASTEHGSTWTPERGKRRTLVAGAVARELAGFCWGENHRRPTRPARSLVEAAADHPAFAPAHPRHSAMSTRPRRPRSILDSGR
jgi:hypothetical protein